MFRLFRRYAAPQYIDEGRVGCPMRGIDIEVDNCARCRWLVDLDVAGNLPLVHCNPRPLAALYPALK